MNKNNYKKSLYVLFCIIILFPSLLLANNLNDSYDNKSNTKEKISLKTAIQLAIYNNASINIAKLSHVSKEFNLLIEKWRFKPHFSFQTTYSYNQSKNVNETELASKVLNIQPSISVLSNFGTQAELSFSNQNVEHFQPVLSLNIAQPLLKGFGKPIVEAALNNAKESEYISRLTFEDTLSKIITQVINSYLDVVSAQKNIEIDKSALMRAKKSVEQTKLYIKAGHKAENELVTVLANFASVKLQLENDKNNYQQAIYGLLSAIGLDPNNKIVVEEINLDWLMKLYHPVSLKLVKELSVKNNISYQIDKFVLQGSLKRSLLIAEDNSRWQLNLNLNKTFGAKRTNGQDVSIDSLLNGKNQTTNVALELKIPIDDKLSQQAILNAKIAIKQAQYSLQQNKWQVETNAINGWNLVQSSLRSLHLAKDAESLQKQTYDLSYQKYLHGLIDSLALQTAQAQLIQAEQSNINAKINHIKSLVMLDMIIGKTLKLWDIEIKLN